MKKTYLMLTILSCWAANAQVEWPEVKIEARITDETGQAISNASVSVWFRKLKTNNPFDGQDTVGFNGVSDVTGTFTAINQTIGLCGAGVQKEGYYVSRAKIDLDKNKDGKWIPWHQIVELKLRKKESPIAMYAKRLETGFFEMPTTNSPAGYDLMAGDWVSPYGKGVTSDLIFTLQREFRGGFDFNWDLSIKFSGEGNGWQAISPAEETPQSELRFPRNAPAESYDRNDMFLSYSRGSRGRWETNSTAATNYFFRVRTQYDSDKQIKSALYGKLLGPIQVNMQHTKTARLGFTYYLNPTSLDRNMEFDPKRNLSKNLSSMEQVNAP